MIVAVSVKYIHVMPVIIDNVVYPVSKANNIIS